MMRGPKCHLLTKGGRFAAANTRAAEGHLSGGHSPVGFQSAPPKPHDMYSYNKRPHDVHNGRLSGEATTLVHPSARRAASRHVVHEDDLLPNTQSERLYNTLAKYGTPPSPSSPTATTHDKNALFSQFVLIRRCYPSSSHASTFPSHMESARLAAGGMLVGQPALERGPAATPHFAPPHTSYDMFLKRDVTQHLYAMLTTMHRCMSLGANNTTPATVYTYTLLLDLYASLLSSGGDAPPSSSSGSGGGGGASPSLSQEEGMSCAISATLELSRVLHTVVRSGGGKGGSFWGKLHPCTHHIPQMPYLTGVSLVQCGLVMALDTYVASTSPLLHSQYSPLQHTPSLSPAPTVGVVVMTDVECAFFVVDSITGAMIRPPVQVLYEKGALTKQSGKASLFHGNVDYMAFIQSFWVETLSSSLEFQTASRWAYRIDPQAWNVLRQLSEDGSLSTAWDTLSSTLSPPIEVRTDTANSRPWMSMEGVIQEERQPRPPLNIISERRLHQREVHSQRSKDREIEQQLLHESLYTASTTQPSLFTTSAGGVDGGGAPSLLPPTQHLTLQTLSPGAINPYKATHGSKKRERERLLDEVDACATADGGVSRAPRNGRFRAVLESAAAAVVNSSSPLVGQDIGNNRTMFPYKDFAVIPIVGPKWVALPRTHLLSNANWNTSPTMMAQEMKYGLFQLCDPCV